jgi:hypothetical protein
MLSRLQRSIPVFEFDKQVKESLKERMLAIEGALGGDGMFYFGPIFPSIEKRFRDFIEQLKQDGEPRHRIIVILNTPGGSAETVEKLVEIIRFHYNEVFFVVPDEAMSAGTIFCMSGDKIYMDYTSSLGPVDPQVHNGKEWVPALGYLDQVERMIKKSEDGTLTDAELLILQTLDLAMLSRYEQAKNLTITLLKKWLVQYKFKDWTLHGTDVTKLNQPVTAEEKQKRAEEIATTLWAGKASLFLASCHHPFSRLYTWFARCRCFSSRSGFTTREESSSFWLLIFFSRCRPGFSPRRPELPGRPAARSGVMYLSIDSRPVQFLSYLLFAGRSGFIQKRSDIRVDRFRRYQPDPFDLPALPQADGFNFLALN